MNLSTQEKLDLKRLLDNSDCQDNTQHIREIKHSQKILTDVCTIERIRRSHPEMKADDLFKEAQSEAAFLFSFYPDIYNRLVKNELDIRILSQLLKVLKLIEDGVLDQHEGSVVVGKILKELYIDSAVRRGNNLDAQYESEKVLKEEGKPISWKEWKSKKA